MHEMDDVGNRHGEKILVDDRSNMTEQACETAADVSRVVHEVAPCDDVCLQSVQTHVRQNKAFIHFVSMIQP